MPFVLPSSAYLSALWTNTALPVLLKLLTNTPITPKGTAIDTATSALTPVWSATGIAIRAARHLSDGIFPPLCDHS